LSVNIRNVENAEYENFENYIPLNLSQSLQNLQVLELTTNHIQAIVHGLELPKSVRKIIFEIQECMGHNNFREIVYSQQSKEMTVDDGDSSEWDNYEKYKILKSFFSKWNKLNNLRHLELKLPFFSEINILMKTLILPLVRSIAQLETFVCMLNHFAQGPPQMEKMTFNLDAFLEEVKDLKSLKNLKIVKTHYYGGFCVCVSYNPEKVSFPPNLNSIEIGVESSSDFNILKFLKGFLDSHLKYGALDMKKCIKIPRIAIFGVPSFMNLLSWMHKASSYSLLKVHLEVDLFVEEFSEIKFHLPDPICLGNNTVLKLNIYITGIYAQSVLLDEDVGYLERVFKKLVSIVYLIQQRPRDGYHWNSFDIHRWSLLWENKC